MQTGHWQLRVGQSQDDIQKRALWTLLAMLGLLVALYGLALFLSWKLNLNDHPEPKIASGLNAFALLFILALAIERVIQPISGFLGPDSAVSKAQQTDSDVSDKSATDTDPNKKKTETQKKATVSDDKSKTALVTWAAATGLACLASVGLNVTLLHAVLDPSQFSTALLARPRHNGPRCRAGTKPLNDLWTSLQSKS